MDNARQSLEGEILRGEALHDREPGGAAAAVAAHLGLGAVGVVKAPAEIRLSRAFEEDQPVGPDAHLAVADPPGQPGLPGLRDNARPVVDEHEVVAPAVHLVKWDMLSVIHANGL